VNGVLTAVPRKGSSLLRRYMIGVGALLFVQGAASLLVRATGRDPHMATRLLSDPTHATIHVLWGFALLGLLAPRDDPALTKWAALAFGVFYVGFLVVGLVVHHPLGMMIDGKENAFHAVIGPLAVILWLREMTRGRGVGPGAPGSR
jgi:hypothetical protein